MAKQRREKSVFDDRRELVAESRPELVGQHRKAKQCQRLLLAAFLGKGKMIEAHWGLADLTHSFTCLGALATEGRWGGRRAPAATPMRAAQVAPAPGETAPQTVRGHWPDAECDSNRT